MKANCLIRVTNQGYECDPTRTRRLYHDCWRFLLELVIENTKRSNHVVHGDQSLHQIRSFVGCLLGDQQVGICSCIMFKLHITDILHIRHKLHIDAGDG